MAVNYDDVLAQLTGFGLKIPRLTTGKFVRCAVEGDREKRGWYILHEVIGTQGHPILIGSYGIWQGNEPNPQKITFEKSELSGEQRAAFKKRLADDKKRADAEAKKRAESASRRSEQLWRKLPSDGHADYLDRKSIQPFGVKFTDKNAIVIPVLNISGRICGLQFILDKVKHKDVIEKYNGRDKQFWPPGLAKKGNFFQIGGSLSDIVLICEGYATGASLHMATGHTVVVAFDANNISPVAAAIKKHNRLAKLLICADNDRFATCRSCQNKITIDASNNCPVCKQPHNRSNAGIMSAEIASLETGAHWIFPVFSDETACFDYYCKNKGKLTDFNDLHQREGLHTVRSQVNHALQEFGWLSKNAVERGRIQQGVGENKLKPIDTVDELLERFSLIYGMNSTVFDHQERIMIKLADMRDACQSRDIHRRWQESPMRSLKRVENVGFDPTEMDKLIECNLWSGWPTTPKAGKCTLLLDLLNYMCSGDAAGSEIYNFVLKWFAYPIQNPGAKMQTALIIHGPQGTGKNIFCDTVMAIYGKYGGIINQAALLDNHNDWASRKLFMIADEVVARSDMYHIKNQLKNLITSHTIRLNPKHLSAYNEKNHMNLVFLSNETMPVVIEEDDRRHAVIWTPEKLSEQFYKEVAAEIKSGGIEALHDYLLNLDLTGFSEHTKPPLTKAKNDLIDLGKDNILRFYDDWKAGEIEGIKLTPVLTEDIYELYKIWCVRQGVRSAPMNKSINQLAKRPGMRKERKRYYSMAGQSNPKFFLFPSGAEEMSPGNSEQGWLGQCVDDFRIGLSDYRGKQYG